MTIHGCVIAGAARAALILGAAGAGKSSLALDLMARGARLVADDRVVLQARDGALIASAPISLAGLIEVRGIGIARVAAQSSAAVSLVVDLDRAAAARLPDPLTWQHSGITLRLIAGREVPRLCTMLELWLRGEMDFTDDAGA